MMSAQMEWHFSFFSFLCVISFPAFIPSPCFILAYRCFSFLTLSCTLGLAWFCRKHLWNTEWTNISTMLDRHTWLDLTCILVNRILRPLLAEWKCWSHWGGSVGGEHTHPPHLRTISVSPSWVTSSQVTSHDSPPTETHKLSFCLFCLFPLGCFVLHLFFLFFVVSGCGWGWRHGMGTRSKKKKKGKEMRGKCGN